MSLLHKKLYDAFVSINLVNPNGKLFTTGSGFLIAHLDHTYLVTHVHVLENHTKILVNLNGSTLNKPINLELSNVIPTDSISELLECGV